jgi:hypothetical protein
MREQHILWWGGLRGALALALALALPISLPFNNDILIANLRSRDVLCRRARPHNADADKAAKRFCKSVRLG